MTDDIAIHSHAPIA